TVAIKMLLGVGGHLRLEGQALAAIRHPGLMKIFGMGRHGRAEYLVLEHLVEDDADLAALIGAYVEQVLRHAEIEIAVDGLDAIGRIARVRPHLIVTDVRMPRMNGVELCMYLRGQQLLQYPTIVAVSSQASENEVELLYSLGISEFVTKGA